MHSNPAKILEIEDVMVLFESFVERLEIYVAPARTLAKSNHYSEDHTGNVSKKHEVFIRPARLYTKLGMIASEARVHGVTYEHLKQIHIVVDQFVARQTKYGPTFSILKATEISQALKNLYGRYENFAIGYVSEDITKFFSSRGEDTGIDLAKTAEYLLMAEVENKKQIAQPRKNMSGRTVKFVHASPHKPWSPETKPAPQPSPAERIAAAKRLHIIRALAKTISSIRIFATWTEGEANIAAFMAEWKQHNKTEGPKAMLEVLQKIMDAVKAGGVLPDHAVLALASMDELLMTFGRNVTSRVEEFVTPGNYNNITASSALICTNARNLIRQCKIALGREYWIDEFAPDRNGLEFERMEIRPEELRRGREFFASHKIDIARATRIIMENAKDWNHRIPEAMAESEAVSFGKKHKPKQKKPAVSSPESLFNPWEWGVKIKTPKPHTFGTKR